MNKQTKGITKTRSEAERSAKPEITFSVSSRGRLKVVPSGNWDAMLDRLADGTKHKIKIELA